MSQGPDVDTRRFDELMERLTEERARVQELRSNYAIIMSSRFHALRMLWFSLKRLFGFGSPDDIYAAWSPNLAPTIAVVPDAAARQPAAAVGNATEQAIVQRWNERIQARAPFEKPLVSIVIPVYNKRAVTMRCLQSIAETWFESLPVEFIVVDDGSSDGTAALLAQMNGIDFVRCGKNEGFIRACNRGAAIARGKYVCFLNNDTTVTNGWLDYLVVTAESDPAIGIVGSKLVYPDGRLQEAGGIIWRDGTGWNYGRFDRPDDPRYNFVRDADYVSGASMLVRTDLFRRLEGFSDEFRPAYYEDVDLCFAARAAGYRVVYQPRSEVTHYEGVTSGDEATGTKRYQEINRPKFRHKWASTLEAHFPNAQSNVFAGARRQRRGELVLVIDSYVTMHDREAGSQRLFHVVKILRALGYAVAFLPDNYAALEPYTSELQQLGVEVLHHVEGGYTLDEALDRIVPLVDVAWISRPHLYDKYYRAIRRNASARLIYDTVDLCHVRQRREDQLRSNGSDAAWKQLQEREVAAARNADATVVVTEDERRALLELGIQNVYVVPTIHDLAATLPRSYEATSGLLFIGNYNHPPNVDAVQWLCGEVMPRVWERSPDVVLTLVGANAPDAVLGLRGDRVRVTGYVPDASSYFANARVFVAPLRFGAGMKGKVGHALAYALPVVTTPVGAEGFALANERSALIVEPDAGAFADAILRLYGDASLWQRLSNAAPAVIAPLGEDAVRDRVSATLTGVGAHGAPPAVRIGA